MMHAPVTATDKIFLQLRDAIVEGVIMPGVKLNEADLAGQYDVSRAVIREAINRLQSCRLVERKANVGARVVELTAQGLLELYQIREALEGMAARQAAEHMSDQEINELLRLLNQHFEEVRSGDSYYQEAGDLDFHYRIILGSKNQQLISLLLDDIYHLVRMYRVQKGMSGPRVTRAYTEHQNIAQAIQTRDAELAEILMRRHIGYSRQQIEQLLTKQQGS